MNNYFHNSSFDALVLLQKPLMYPNQTVYLIKSQKSEFMKKLFVLLCCSGSLMLANADTPNNNAADYLMVSNKGDESITLINDTPNKLKIHTGTGEVTLNPRGGKTSFSCTKGKTVKADGVVIFKVSEEMCGKTIKLSEYVKS